MLTRLLARLRYWKAWFLWALDEPDFEDLAEYGMSRDDILRCHKNWAAREPRREVK